MKVANILLRHPIDEAETRWRGQHADLILGKVAPPRYQNLIFEENPDAELCDYVLAPGTESARTDLVRLSFFAMATHRAEYPGISGLLYDVPINYGPVISNDGRHAQLSMLAEVQGSVRGLVFSNVVDPQLLIEGPTSWEPWCRRLKNVATAYLIENWELSKTTDALVDAIKRIEKPMVIMFRRAGYLTPEQAQEYAIGIAQELDAPDRWFGYRDAEKWVDPRRLEEWQWNPLFDGAGDGE